MPTVIKLSGSGATVTAEVDALDVGEVALILSTEAFQANFRALAVNARGLGVALIEAADQADEQRRKRAYDAAHGKTRRRRAEAAARRAEKKGGS